MPSGVYVFNMGCVGREFFTWFTLSVRGERDGWRKRNAYFKKTEHNFQDDHTQIPLGMVVFLIRCSLGYYKPQKSLSSYETHREIVFRIS